MNTAKKGIFLTPKTEPAIYLEPHSKQITL